ncbi:MAG: hypothetical protein PHT51_04300 [Patescibacteria group bacterium]|nr:hypothetical protein [Patescibacteria group bacterium]MDD4610758.1 hypothetical protein [Patescibacteria group bacterium]
MNKQNINGWVRKLEKKTEKREKKRKPRMKVSGAGVKSLQKIIIAK